MNDCFTVQKHLFCNENIFRSVFGPPCPSVNFGGKHFFLRLYLEQLGDNLSANQRHICRHGKKLRFHQNYIVLISNISIGCFLRLRIEEYISPNLFEANINQYILLMRILEVNRFAHVKFSKRLNSKFSSFLFLCRSITSIGSSAFEGRSLQCY